MLIVLHGTTSSGKTSLAKALQALSSRPLLHIEADRFAPTVGPNYGTQDHADFRSRYVIAMHEAIAAFGRNGLDTVVDGSLPDELALRDPCLTILRDVPETTVIAVRCSVEVLREREAVRKDRVPAWAEKQALTIYEGIDFDFVVDTTSQPATELARKLSCSLFPS